MKFLNRIKNQIKKTEFLFLLFYCLFISHQLKADGQQTVFNDSLKQYSIDTLKSLSSTNFYKDFDTSKIYALEILNRGFREKNIKYQLDAYFLLGTMSLQKGIYKEALSYYNEGIVISEKNNKRLYALKFYLGNGNTHLYSDNYEAALSGYQKTIELAKALKNKEYEIIGYLNIALIKKEIGQYNEALEIEKQNVKRANEITITNNIQATLYTNLSNSFLNLKEHDSSIYYAKKGLNISAKGNSLVSSSYLYNIIGCAYQNKKQDSLAIFYFSKALSIVKSLENKRRTSATHFLIGKSYANLNQQEKAINNLLEAEKAVEDIPNLQIEELRETYKLLAKIYSQQNEKELANNYYRKYVQSDSLADLSKTDIIDDLYYDDLKKERNKFQTASKEKYSLQFLLASSVILFVVVTVILLFYIRKIKFKKQSWKRNTQKAPSKIKRQNIKIPDEKAMEILKKLEAIEVKEYFLKSDFSLNTLAKKLKSNPSYVSRVINTYKKMHFHEYTNELRMNYTLKRLNNDPKFRSYSILYISKEVGYKSPDSFTKHFKKRTGTYPSSYIHDLKKTQFV